MYFALIEPGTYLDFADPVPFAGPDGPIERGVMNTEGGISGRAQAAVRAISAVDFNRIIAAGLDDQETPLPPAGAARSDSGWQEEQASFIFEQSRDRVISLSSRLVRDRVFRRIVLRAYDLRCAVTGLRLINGGGRAEVEAAHIRPVEASGPDTVRNGLALSGTAHWMFDRGLIGIEDDLQIIISRHVNDQDGVRAMINKTTRILPPLRSSERPHPHFLRWHRENCFKA
jgi:putative restriction endonuclease